MRRAALGLAVVLFAGGCSRGTERAEMPTATTEAGSQPRPALEPPVEPVRCPAEAANCRSAAGTILYIERVDPDGDGDAHFVVLDSGGVTAPGISVIDVARNLRPHPLPVTGELISAAGPVFEGSYGQRQIQATEVRVGPG